MTTSLDQLPHSELVARLTEAQRSSCASDAHLQEMAQMLSRSEALTREAEAHASELGCLLGELGAALGLRRESREPVAGLPPARRLAYAEDLLQRIRSQPNPPLEVIGLAPGSQFKVDGVEYTLVKQRDGGLNWQGADGYYMLAQGFYTCGTLPGPEYLASMKKYLPAPARQAATLAED